MAVQSVSVASEGLAGAALASRVHSPDELDEVFDLGGEGVFFGGELFDGLDGGQV